VAVYREKRAAFKQLAKDLKRRVEARRELALETETLQRALETIDAIDPQPGEDEDLKMQIQRLQAADELRAQMGEALAAIDGSAGEVDPDVLTAVDMVARAESALRSDDEQLEKLANRLGEISTLLSDVAMEVGQALADVPDPDELEGMLERQQQLRELRKF